MFDFGVVERVADETLADEYAKNPFAGKSGNEWVEGGTSIQFLNDKFGQYSTAQEMIDITEDEGLKMFFAWLKEQGKLP
jgi:hypothetical protein